MKEKSMFIKWIVCEVEEDQKPAFSLAQEKWRKMVSSKGFLCQTGGWDIDNQNLACVIAFWENEADLQFFMKNMHDEIFHENNQNTTYKSINISHFNGKLEMHGQSSSLIDAFRKSSFLRIADCLVKPDRIVHFEKVQQEIWMPGMKNSRGMLGGFFSEDSNIDNRYLVSTFWDSEENHAEYVNSKLPVFQKTADIKSDLENITGRKVRLVDSWKVVR